MFARKTTLKLIFLSRQTSIKLIFKVYYPTKAGTSSQNLGIKYKSLFSHSESRRGVAKNPDGWILTIFSTFVIQWQENYPSANFSKSLQKLG